MKTKKHTITSVRHNGEVVNKIDKTEHPKRKQVWIGKGRHSLLQAYADAFSIRVGQAADIAIDYWLLHSGWDEIAKKKIIERLNIKQPNDQSCQELIHEKTKWRIRADSLRGLPDHFGVRVTRGRARVNSFGDFSMKTILTLSRRVSGNPRKTGNNKQRGGRWNE